MSGLKESLSCSRTEKDRRNQRIVILWSLLWAASFLLLTFGLANEWWSSKALTLAGVTGFLVLGLGTLLAYRRFLAEADELRRKIELDGLALGYGVGILGGLSYWLLEIGGFVDRAELPEVLAVMMVVYSLGVMLGSRRYR